MSAFFPRSSVYSIFQDDHAALASAAAADEALDLDASDDPHSPRRPTGSAIVDDDDYDLEVGRKGTATASRDMSNRRWRSPPASTSSPSFPSSSTTPARPLLGLLNPAGRAFAQRRANWMGYESLAGVEEGNAEGAEEEGEEERRRTGKEVEDEEERRRTGKEVEDDDDDDDDDASPPASIMLETGGASSSRRPRWLSKHGLNITTSPTSVPPAAAGPSTDAAVDDPFNSPLETGDQTPRSRTPSSSDGRRSSFALSTNSAAVETAVKGTTASKSQKPSSPDKARRTSEPTSAGSRPVESIQLSRTGAARSRSFSSSARPSHHPRSQSRFSSTSGDGDQNGDADSYGYGYRDAGPSSRLGGMSGLDEREKALWKWVNVEDLDSFLQEAYAYYVGKGLVCIVLSRVLNLFTVAFVIGFTTFLLGCVDYSRIRHDGNLHEVVVPHCVSRFSGLTLFLLFLFSAMFGWQVVRFGFGLRRLIDMYRFYTHLLNIPDADIQTISWSDVVTRISLIRSQNPSTAFSSSRPGGHGPREMDAHDIANRIMRQENYLIALFNKDLLNLTVPFPGLRNLSPVLTRTLEWNLSFCLLGYLFDRRGRVRRAFVSSRHRADLIEGLRRRFIFMGVLNAIFAPFIVLYLLMYSFFRYFEEYHKNPSTIGSRQYTQFARWKFREFNELPHLFQKRLASSYPLANAYINQFPKERVALLSRFVAFVAGSFAAVLLLASVLDPDLFLHFEITSQRTVLFYIGLFGTVVAVARSMIPDENQVFEPEVLLRAVVEHTHYLPDSWKGKMHSAEVHAAFGSLFTLKVLIFIQELLSVLFTPFVLFSSLPKCAPALIDFFREFTVHVEGVGYVCSFAVFDFKRHGNVRFGAPTEVTDARLMSKEGKMEKSFIGFKASTRFSSPSFFLTNEASANHPDWVPQDPSSSLYLSRLTELGVADPSHHLRPATGLTSPLAGRLHGYHPSALATATATANRFRSPPVDTGAGAPPPPTTTTTTTVDDAHTSGRGRHRHRAGAGTGARKDTTGEGEDGPEEGLAGVYDDMGLERDDESQGAGKRKGDDDGEAAGVLGLLGQIYRGASGPAGAAGAAAGTRTGW